LLFLFFIFEHGTTVRANRIALFDQSVADFTSKHVFLNGLFTDLLRFSVL
jgi:hypothetical protein